MIQPIGYIKLWREIASKPIWLNSTPEQKTILITLMMMVNFKPKKWEWKGERFEVKEGQVVTSLESITENCGKGITIQNVRTALKRFEKLEFLTNESTKTGRLITVANWGLYQSDEENQQSCQQTANKDLTDSQQRANKDLTPREEGKEREKSKEGKKEKTFLSDSIEYGLAYKLFSRMQSNNPKVKEPNFQVWAKHIDAMIRIDGRQIEDIEKVIDWCQQDSFWKCNILSTAKLREKFDQLAIKAIPAKSKNKTRKVVDF